MSVDATKARASGHPGSGRRRAATHPKGRQVEPRALEQIRELLGDRPNRRDLLIEHLHEIQDRYGHLSDAHLAALADWMRLPLAEVYEVATFYAHFDVLKDGQSPPPPLTVRVCESVSCFLAGAERLLESLKGGFGPEVRVLRAPCMGQCDRAPAAMIGQQPIGNATADSIKHAVAEGRTAAMPPVAAIDFGKYVKAGGYRILRDCLEGRLDRDAVISQIGDSGLRGLGGAGFRSGMKWSFVRQAPKPRLMAVNADEGEPGTFKDRYLLETDPHRVLEGMLIAAWAVEAEEVYFYLRDEYPQIRALLIRELPKLAANGLAEPGRIHLRRGAGAYICGEETAMLESLEGKRGYPRHKPPFPTQVGLFGRPTLIHNVETLSWVRDVIERGPEWYVSQGRHDRKGLRYFSVSGRVQRPGIVRAPAGTTARELIEEHCGGMRDGHTFKGYLPGGASGGILPASLADEPLDFGTLEPHGCFIGSAAVVVFSDRDSAREIALNLLRFFEHESCGQCTPCRCGTEKAARLMEQPAWDLPLLGELAGVMRDASICGLGQAAPNPLLSVIRSFPEDLR